MQNKKKILFYCPNNNNNASGSTNFTINTIKLFSKMNMETHFIDLYKSNINVNLSTMDKNIVIHGYPDRNENINMVNFIGNLHNELNFDYIFIRSIKLINEKEKIDLLSKIKSKVIIFIWDLLLPEISPDLFLYILIKFNYYLFSSQYMLDKIRNQYPTFVNNKNYDWILPILDHNATINPKKIKNTLIYDGNTRYLYPELLNFYVKNPMYILNLCIDPGKYQNLKLKNKNITNNFFDNAHKKQFEIFLEKNEYGFAYRNSEYDNCLDISSKLLEYMNHGLLPILNRSKINIILFGENYPFYISNISEIGKILSSNISENIKCKYIISNKQISILYTIESHSKRLRAFFDK